MASPTINRTEQDTLVFAFLYLPGTSNDDLSNWHCERLVEDGATYLGAAAC